jgi:phage tail tape-measure protein
MSNVIRSLIVRVGADLTGFSQGMKAISKDLEKTSKKWEKAGKAMTDHVTKPILAVGAAMTTVAVSGIKGAAELEAYRNTLNTVLKDSTKAAKTMAWAVDFANKTPFETDSVVEATVRLAAYGMEAEKVLPGIGDMASVMNKDIMQAVEAVADAQTGELERLKDFGITKQMIIDHGNKVMRGKEIVNAKGQITDQENFNKVLFSLMEERFKGGMEIQANSFNGLMSTFTGTAKTMLAQMVGVSATGEIKIGGLFDRAKQKLKELTDKITQWQNDGTLDKWATKVSDFFTTLFDTLEESVFPVLKEVGGILKDILEWFSDLPPKTQEFILKALLLGAALGPVVSGISGIMGFAANFTGFLSNVTKATGASKTVGATGAITRLGGALSLLVGPAGYITLAVAGLWALYEINKKIKEDPEGASRNYGAGLQYSTYENTANNLLGKQPKKPPTTQLGHGGTRPGDVPAMIPMYENGTPYVPTTGLALIHKGERITPANQNNGVQTINHTGTITVRGVNNRGELVAVVEQEISNKLVQDNRRIPNRTSLMPIG